MPINVKTSVYEGPLDLLLELIEKRKLLINDISLAQVTDEYIQSVNAMDELPIGETAEFVALAATLLLIKSRSLLPTLELSDDESRDIKELEYRLAVYQMIKDAARGLGASLNNPPLYEGNTPEPDPLFIPDSSATPQSLRSAAQVLINGFPSTLTLPKISVKKIISIEEMIDNLAQRVSSALSLSFRIFTDKKEKAEVIVGFLAMLELVKQGILKAHQERDYGDIMLHSDAPSTPSYE
ncbi:segregation/condensation protein A [Candidatus Parcubacteria bacterium]|nr:segregation/condensation protein A [Candidatus Parcubacteria bacterium]